MLGVGAQKAGTTWLHHQLNSLPFADFGMLKEYHVFDSLYVDEFKERNEKIKARGDAQAGDDVEAKGLKSKLQKTHASFLENTANYFAYFDELADARAGITMTGDITPTYSALPEPAFAQIREGLEARGFRVKVVFLMRDPVERCWSMMRMKERLELRRFGHHNLQMNGQRRLLQLYRDDQMTLRTRYDLTVPRIESVFAPEDIFIGFYETLFSPDSVARLCDTLGIRPFEADFGRQVNVSEKTWPLDEAVRTKVARHYRSVYAFVENRYGREFVDAHWPSAPYARRPGRVVRWAQGAGLLK